MADEGTGRAKWNNDLAVKKSIFSLYLIIMCRNIFRDFKVVLKLNDEMTSSWYLSIAYDEDEEEGKGFGIFLSRHVYNILGMRMN